VKAKLQKDKGFHEESTDWSQYQGDSGGVLNPKPMVKVKKKKVERKIGA